METENKLLGKVTDAKILKAERDRRSKRKSGLDGLVVEFETSENLKDGDLVNINHNHSEKSKWQTFQVREIEAKGDNLLIRATEIGYFATFLSREEDLDLRKLIGSNVELIVDEEHIKSTRESSYWC